MRISTSRPRSGRALLMTTAAAGLTLLTVAATGAHAQDTSSTTQAKSDNNTVVVVTGIRKSLADSLTIKRKSASIVEAVSAEDIGKLPDQSIAESLARLPGLAAQRVGGRSQTISIRGLSPDFASTLWNGRMQVSSGDNRAAEFDQYPSEMISSAIVYKTPDAGLTGQGLSGTVVLNTVRPLDYRHRLLSVNVRGSVNTNGVLNPGTKDTGNRLSFTYIDQFMDGKLGVALSYAHLDDPSQLKHSKSWWWDTEGNDSITGQPRYGAGNGDALGLQGVEAWATSRKQVRDGYMGVIDFKPNDNFRSVNDFYYSSYDQAEVTHGAQWYQSQWTDDSSNMHMSNVTVTNMGGSKVVFDQTVSGLVPIIRNDYNTRHDEMVAVGSNDSWTMAGWRAVADFGYSRAVRKESISETYAGYGTNPTPLSRTPDPAIVEHIPFGGFPQLKPTLNYADASQVYLGDAAPWGGWSHDGTMRNPKVTDTLSTARFTASRDLSFGPFKSVELGLDYSHRVKNKGVVEYDLCLKGWNQAKFDCHGTRVAVAASDLESPTDIGWAGFGKVLSTNVPVAINKYYDKRPILNEDNLAKYYTIEENLTTGLVKFDIDTQLDGHALTGNLGIQYVYGQDNSSGYVVTQPSGAYGDPTHPAKGKWNTVSNNDNQILPSLNLVYQIDDESDFRFGLSRAMARPRMDDMRAGINAGVSQTTFRWSGGGGNPHLKPWIADGVDFAYEHYFSKSSYISANFFQKVMRSYIRGVTNNSFDFTGYFNSTGITPTTNIGSFSEPENGKGGDVSGLELAASLDGKLIWRPLDGFGAVASLARGWTDIKAGDPTDPNSLPGFSGDVGNLTLYYEKNGFSARINGRYRSAFLGEVVQLFANRGQTRILADKQVDAQLSYDIQNGPLKNMTLLLQVYNLTNSNYQTQLSVSNVGLHSGKSFPENYEEYGQTVIFGFNYKFQ